MLYVVTSDKSLDQVCSDLEEAVVAHKFGLMATHNLRETMAKKGVSFDRECRVFEVCNPHQAKKVLESRIEVSTALPCRISIFEEEGKVKLATMKPSMMLGIFEAPDLDSVAAEVETSIMAIMQDAAG
ncbi:MAG: DUF302 domain-containing protein [Verrucomicrobia bacterium]|nr:MAG: DUF302 domain-containing protein [Verrucomicrobiota bacterium]